MNRQKILSSYLRIRKKTEILVKDLRHEEMVVQTENFVSPIKWHLAHTTWFFENFVLKKFKRNYKTYDKDFNYLFNSYYNSAGKFNEKSKRGLFIWPLVSEVLKYRKKIDEMIIELIISDRLSDKSFFFINLGLNHEQQHQELILMDILNIFSYFPQKKAFKKKKNKKINKISKPLWSIHQNVSFEYGFSGNQFSYDNEKPSGKKKLNPFKISLNFITIGEWLEFIENKGYQDSKYWLSDGWDYINTNNIERPMYWIDNKYEYTLCGIEKLDKKKPVSNISFYEADAFCRFTKKRLPTEFELEFFLKKNLVKGNFLESKNMTPISFDQNDASSNSYGNVWCWTSSNYTPYVGYSSYKGDIGEYNKKFMCNQFVLKGGSFATPKSHIRASYRNYYYPNDRWQFSGMRVAEDI